MATCLITSCGLSIYPEYQFCGDLFEEGDCYIFNACGSEEGLDSPLDLCSQLVLIINPDCQAYFQRRNVFVINKTNAHLNEAAVKYLQPKANNV